MNSIFRMPEPPQSPEIPMVPSPMVYVQETVTWEYKQVTRNLSKESAMTEDELNKLGAEGWELAGILTNAKVANFYFKRLAV